MRKLADAEDQLRRIAENKAPRVDGSRILFRKKSIQLMTAVVKFFHSALQYFGASHLRKSCIKDQWLIFEETVWNVVTSQEMYQDAAKALQDAIQTYNDASKDETQYHISERTTRD